MFCFHKWVSSETQKIPEYWNIEEKQADMPHHLYLVTKYKCKFCDKVKHTREWIY
jgi:hypothetical protein